jgi:hypothetical protein
MEQRTLRLGDIVDDYCPRERRITNHAIVAMIEDAIRQTRCATCEAEHVFRGARAPKRRKKDEEPTPFDQVLADVTGAQLVPARTAADDMAPLAGADTGPGGDATDGATAESDADHISDATRGDGWLAHRQLIRATLPRIEGEVPTPRPIPEFTMHQRQGPGRGFRGPWQNHGGGNGGNGNVNGNVNGNTAGGGNGYRAGVFRSDRPSNGQGPASGGGGGRPGGGAPGGVPGGGRPARRHRGKKRPPR